MISEVTAALDANEDDVRAYAAHVQSCATCKQANTTDELCAVGGPLWDVIDDDDPTAVER